VEFDLSQDIWMEAGRRFAEYSKRRRRSGVGEPKRLLVDFLVGAHALLRADRLYTLDASRYKRDFPELDLLK
jgi:predicted nucleic acid-binding protein